MMLSVFYRRLKGYFRYRLKARGRYRIHSPFLYQLLTQCFYQKTDFKNWIAIEAYRKKLWRDDTQIEVNDLGAGTISGKIKRRKIAQIVRHSLSRKKYAQLLYKMVNYFQCKTILELGTSLGISTTYMAKANAKAKVYSIEGCANIAAQAEKTFQILNVKNIELFNMPFDKGLQQVFGICSSYDFIFIDGNHRYEATLSYFEQCLKHIHNDSVLVLDDIHWSEQMEAAWQQITLHPAVTLTLDLYQYGIVFFRKELSRQYFMIKY